ncbi:alpha/beta hydrolase [Rhizobium grahamii]|uniref:alpha/beta hydrolase n=1 Tax=Rhizobium grahamii TaxID=1120045 RepID=UPI003CC81DB4
MLGRHRTVAFWCLFSVFNNRFEDPVYRFAQIAHDSGVHSTPVLTWPSLGSLLSCGYYGYDRESTN